MKPFKDNPNKASVNKDEKLLKPAHFKVRRVDNEDETHNETALYETAPKGNTSPEQKNPILLGNAEKTRICLRADTRSNVCDKSDD